MKRNQGVFDHLRVIADEISATGTKPYKKYINTNKSVDLLVFRDVARRCNMNNVRGKDAQKQWARPSVIVALVWHDIFFQCR